MSSPLLNTGNQIGPPEQQPNNEEPIQGEGGGRVLGVSPPISKPVTHEEDAEDQPPEVPGDGYRQE